MFISRFAHRAAALALASVPLTLGAQAHGSARPQDHAAAARAALAPLSALVGRWEGTATISTGPRETMQVRQFEEVVWGAGGTVLFVRGTGRMMQSDSIVFEAAASIWYDPDARALRMRAHRAEGVAVAPDIELRPDTLVWGFPAGPGRVRFTIAFSATSWHEIGEFLMEGRPPARTIEMRLKRP